MVVMVVLVGFMLVVVVVVLGGCWWWWWGDVGVGFGMQVGECRNIPFSLALSNTVGGDVICLPF